MFVWALGLWITPLRLGWGSIAGCFRPNKNSASGLFLHFVLCLLGLYCFRMVVLLDSLSSSAKHKRELLC